MIAPTTVLRNLSLAASMSVSILHAQELVMSAAALTPDTCKPTKGILVDTGCEAYVWNGEVYTASGTYEQHFTNVAGCDSTTVLSLTIADIDTSVVGEGPTLFAQQADAMYQWVDCDQDHMPIGTATDPWFTPEANGHYAVMITVAGCTMTSGCHLVLSTTIATSADVGTPIMAPNPARGLVSLGSHEALGRVAVFDAKGRIVRAIDTADRALTWSTMDLRPGLYMVRGMNGTRTWAQRLVVE